MRPLFYLKKIKLEAIAPKYVYICRSQRSTAMSDHDDATHRIRSCTWY